MQNESTRRPVEVRFGSGEEPYPFLTVSPSDILRGGPGRDIPTYHGQSSKPVTYWFAKTGEHIKVESKLERTRLMLMDFDPSVARVKSQPFLMTGPHQGKVFNHVPDFFVLLTTGMCRIENVKHISHAGDERTIRTAAFVQENASLRGWESEMWTGRRTPPALIHNLRGLAGFRIAEWLSAEALEAARSLKAVTLRDAEKECKRKKFDPTLVRGAIMHLLWRQEWTFDFTRPLLGTTEFDRA
jgi:hypothetical protein